uniref:Reverse transcriptase domain-containing protein n=1 Tax=Gadus morhua TaxID=8049 RepID=A0A8C5BXC6_GADMO
MINITKCTIGTITLSDHAKLTLKVNLNSNKGKYLWRMNNSLLQNGDLKDTVKKTLKEYLEFNDTEDINSIILWEGAKAVLRGELIRYSSLKKKQREQLKTELEIQIKALEDKHKKSLDMKLNKLITEEEISQQIKKLKTDKAPGDDGYTNEFYKEFRELLVPLLLNAYNFALESGVWASTWNSSVITVIYKDGKEKMDTSSYRPISLLNTDQKILTSIIANRLKDILPDLIDSDQTGFICNRFLSDNVRRTLDIIDFSQKYNKDLLLLTLDAEKAFDRVLWPYIFKTAKAFGFHSKFISWLELIYKNPVAQVRVNGTLSRRFQIHKGTRQGDPMSALIFAMCMEPLAEAIRQQDNIKGLTIGQECHKLDDTSKVITDKNEIAETFATYYEKLYKDETDKTNSARTELYLEKLNLKQVSSLQNTNLIIRITEEEISQQIKKLKTDKAPGDDGYTNEFYKEFRELLVPLLLNAYNFALESGVWASTWNSSVITVIYKDGKEKMDTSSYRPISLLNTDQKILTSIIANRLKDILPDLIDSDQTGFICNRFLSDNVRRTLDIIDFSQKYNKDLLLLTLDAEKAFDRVLWPYIFKTAKAFGFHSKFISWLELIYKNPVAQVRVNGTLSRRFQIHKGTRQGDPMSALIFAMCMEPLAEAIRQQDNIKGLTIGQECHKLALYADDIIVYLTSPEHSLPELMETIKEYSDHSGYKINENKCESICIGKQLTDYSKGNLRFKWNQDKLKYLGIIIHKDLSKVHEVNYQNLENKIKQDLNRWKTIPNSLFSRVDTIKMMVLPQFLFLFQNLPTSIPSQSFKRWNGIITNFIWNNKRKRVKFKTLIKSKEHGGLALPDLQTYFHATQINNIMKWTNDNIKAKWLPIEKEQTPFSIKTLPFIDRKDMTQLKGQNRWINNTLCTWKQICKKHDINKELFYLREMAWDPDFKPNKMDNVLKVWSLKGLQIYSQIITKYEVNPFDVILKKYDLVQSNFYKYLQLRNYIKTFQKRAGTHEQHPLVQFMIKNYNIDIKNTLSKIYKILQENNETQDTVALKWNLELEGQLKEEDWENIYGTIHKTTNSRFWREYAWKIYTRFFITPKIQSKFKTSNSSECWRNCGENNADHSHVFYFCPSLNTFWKLITNSISNIFQINQVPEPKCFILGVTPDELISERDKYLFRILRIAAMKQITRNWLKPTPPSFKNWKSNINNILEMERITYITRNLEIDENQDFQYNYMKQTYIF